MPSKFRDRVYEQTSSKGTGTITLNGAPLGYQSFSVFGDGNQAYYVIAQNQADQWEIGLGTVHITAGVTTLARTTVLRSSNANAAVDFNVTGKMEVRCPLPADLMDYLVDPSTLIHKDGSVTFTGNQDLGGHDLTTVGKLNKITFTQPATGATFTPADNSSLITSGANAVTITSTGTTNVTLPSGTRTLVGRDTTDTLTNKTLTSPVLNQPTINGSGGALTLPAGPDSFVGRATTDTLTNKTLTSPVLNQPTINGSGGTLTLPAGPTTLVGRDTTDTLTNKSIDAGQLTGTIVAGRMPALTGDVTTTAGAVATTIGSNVVTFAKQQQVAANSLVGNPTGALANVQAIGLGTSMQFAATTLNTIQGIRTSDTPQFAALGLGTAAVSQYGIKAFTVTSGAADQKGLYAINTFSNTATTTSGLVFSGSIAASSVVGSAYTIQAQGWILGSGASLTEMIHYDAQSNTIGGSRNIAYQGQQDAAATGAWNAYMKGTAPNYFNGAIQTHTGTALAKTDFRATSGGQLGLSYDALNSLIATVDSTGLVTWTGAGTGKGHVFTDGVRAGTGAARAKMGGTLKSIITSAPNGTTVETDLQSATIVANTVGDGDSLEIWQDFQIANNGNNKTIKLYLNGTQIMTSGAAAVAGQSAQIITTIKRLSSTSTLITTQFIPMTGSAWSRNDVLSEQNINWTGSIVIKATGQSSAASNDIVQRSTIVLYNPANP